MRRVAALALGALCLLTPVRAADAIHVDTAARSIQPGEVVVLTARATGAPLDHLRVRAFDRDVPVAHLDDDRWQAVLGIDLDITRGSYAVSFDGSSDGGAVTTEITLVVRPRAFATRRLQVDDSFLNPPEPVIARFTEEAAELDRLWTQSAPARLWTEGFIRPVPGPANSAFGSRSIFNGKPRQPHGGADFRSPEGTPVLAPNSGRVVLARDLYFTGNTVVIDHGLGMFSLLAHLSVVDVRDGDDVMRGQTIGRVGATGRVTGPHLHWGVRLNGARVDPLSVVAVLSAPH